MTKYLLAALALVAALLGGWGAYGHYRVLKLQADIAVHKTTIANQNTAILAQQAKDKRNTLVLKDMAARNAALLASNKKASNDLSSALKAAPDWAAAPVPAAVADWVRNTPSTSSTGTGHTPSLPTP